MNSADSILMPGSAAFEEYLAQQHDAGPHPVVVIEGGYFDARYPASEERFAHLRDSFALLELFGTTKLEAAPTVLLAALVNDLDMPRACGIQKSCELPDQRDHRGPISFVDLPDRARAIYDQHLVDYPHTHRPEVFTMRQTRNGAARHMRRRLEAHDPRYFNEPAEPGRSAIIARADAADIRVGSITADRRTISVRCAGLMAQHYFDLFNLYAHPRVEQISSFWIFDFNRYSERQRVRTGAEVSFACYPWPPGIPARVVNCIYQFDRPDSRPIEVTASTPPALLA